HVTGVQTCALPISVADGLELAGAPDLGGLPLGPAGGEDGQAARQQIVTAVAVLDLDGVTGRTEMVHLGGQNEFHLSRLSYSVSVARPSAPTRRTAAAPSPGRSSRRWRCRSGAARSCR